MTRPDHESTQPNPDRYGDAGAAYVLGAPAPAPPPPHAAEPVASAPVYPPPAQAYHQPAPRVASSATALATPTAAPPLAAPPLAAPPLAAPPLAAPPLAAPPLAAPPLAAPTPVAAPAAARAAAPAPEGPPGGTLYGSRHAADADRHDGAPMPLHVGSHTVSYAALARLGAVSPGAGLILGADRDQRPVPLRLLRPEPTRATLVGGLWAGQVIAFRALALGARLVVVTAEPQAWQGFGERATGRGDRVMVLAGERPVAVPATADQPALFVYDLGVVGAGTPPPLGPWQTQFTVLRQLTVHGVSAVQDAHVVMLQRLGGAESALAASALRLTDQSGQLLQMLEDDMLALIGGGADRYVWVMPTGVEHQFAGPPRR